MTTPTIYPAKRVSWRGTGLRRRLMPALLIFTGMMAATTVIAAPLRAGNSQPAANGSVKAQPQVLMRGGGQSLSPKEKRLGLVRVLARMTEAAGGGTDVQTALLLPSTNGRMLQTPESWLRRLLNNSTTNIKVIRNNANLEMWIEVYNYNEGKFEKFRVVPVAIQGGQVMLALHRAGIDLSSSPYNLIALYGSRSQYPQAMVGNTYELYGLDEQGNVARAVTTVRGLENFENREQLDLVGLGGIMQPGDVGSILISRSARSNAEPGDAGFLFMAQVSVDNRSVLHNGEVLATMASAAPDFWNPPRLLDLYLDLIQPNRIRITYADPCTSSSRRLSSLSAKLGASCPVSDWYGMKVYYEPVTDGDSWENAESVTTTGNSVDIPTAGMDSKTLLKILGIPLEKNEKPNPLQVDPKTGKPLPGDLSGEVVMTTPKRSMPADQLLSDQGAGLGNFSMTFDPSTPGAPYYEVICKDETMAWNSSPTPMALRENKGANKRGGARALNPPKRYEVAAPASTNPTVVIPASDFAANGPVECTALPEDIRGGKADGTDNLGYPLVDADGHLESNTYASFYLGTWPKPPPAVNNAALMVPISYLLQ